MIKKQILLLFTIPLIVMVGLYFAISGFYINENTSSVINWFNNKVNISNEEYMNLVGDTTATIKSLNVRISTLETENIQLVSERDSLIEQVEDLENDVIANEEEILELNNKISNLDNKILENESTIEELNSLINSMNAEVLASSVDVPEEFSGVKSIYYHQVDNILLFSGNLMGLGVWSYNLETAVWMQLYDQGMSWDSYQIIKDRCLISSSLSTSGLLVYDTLSNKITKLSDNSIFSKFQIIGDRCLLGHLQHGIYDYESNTFKMIYTTNFQPTHYYVFNDRCLITSSNITAGVLVYDYETDTCELKYTYGKYWSSFESFGDKCLITGGSSGYSAGILVYDYTTNSFEQKLSSGSHWTKIQKINDRCLISSTNSSYCGIYVYDATLNTLEKISAINGYGWIYKKIGNRVLIGGRGTTEMCRVMCYDYDTNTCTDLYYKNHYYWTSFQEIGDYCLIGGDTTTPGLLLYNSIDNTIEVLSNASSYLRYFLVIGNKCFISTGSQYDSYLGLFMFNSEDKSVTKVYMGGYMYDSLQEKDGKYYIFSSDQNKNPRTLCYNPADGSVKLVKYHVEITE